jgi:hypothetical protein
MTQRPLARRPIPVRRTAPFDSAVALAGPAVALSLALAGATAALAADFPADFPGFQKDLSPAVAARLDTSTKHFRQIEPSLYYLCRSHADRLAVLADDARLDTIVKLARFIDGKREATADVPVIGPGRTLIGLLDPDRGLDPREITAIAAAYGARATVFKQATDNGTLREVGDRFLAAVRQAAAGPQAATVVVLGHGLPGEIQSYHIPFGRVADELVSGAAAAGTAVDLGRMVVICDDCYSADFLTNLGDAIEARCRDRGLALASLPAMIAGTNRDRVGHADFGEKFVPHFWKDVIELFFVRRPRPERITLADFFEKVDNMMYGYGRAPIVQGGEVVGYRLVDPELCQDPVIFVPLSAADLDELRTILGLPADAPLPRFLDIG